MQCLASAKCNALEEQNTEAVKKIKMIIFFLCSCFLTVYANLAERYSAVTSLKGHEQFYFDIKKSGTQKPHFKEETFEKKLEVCSAIMNSVWFNEHLNFVPITSDYNATQLEKIKKFYVDNFSVHPTEHKVPNETKEFENPYVLHDVPSNERSQKYEEYAFLCIATNDETGVIGHYFISPEYDVKDSGMKDAGNPTGRFVFVKNGMQKREIFPFALAESPANKLEHGPDSVEHIFQDEIRDEVEEKNVTVGSHSRAICELTSFQKLRLCSVIMNAKRYREEITFIPSDDHGLKCFLKEIHFKHFAELHYDDNEVDEDIEEWWQSAPPIEMWMLACHGAKCKNDTSLNYYIASSFSARQKFFVSKGHEGNVTLLDSIVSTVLV